jgi:ABC-type transport system substrate-binding protein
MECKYSACRSSLKPWNAATNFSSPSLSVKSAVSTQLLKSNQRILEFGAGNLRNALFIMNTIHGIQYSVVEIPEVITRFYSNYQAFQQMGGNLLKQGFKELKFDAVICTFVLETICPLAERVEVLKSLVEAMDKDAMLITSFRGYPGVKGTKYRQCLAREGYISPRSTFIKPYSLPEVRQLLEDAGLNNIETLEKYRVKSPQNIHIIARLK